MSTRGASADVSFRRSCNRKMTFVLVGPGFSTSRDPGARSLAAATGLDGLGARRSGGATSSPQGPWVGQPSMKDRTMHACQFMWPRIRPTRGLNNRRTLYPTTTIYPSRDRHYGSLHALTWWQIRGSGGSEGTRPRIRIINLLILLSGTPSSNPLSLADFPTKSMAGGSGGKRSRFVRILVLTS